MRTRLGELLILDWTSQTSQYSLVFKTMIGSHPNWPYQIPLDPSGAYPIWLVLVEFENTTITGVLKMLILLYMFFYCIPKDIG